ncbi:MAG TPA: IPT/TIG domain-containing protein [Candidatus Nanopelagicales bacterium]|nr:IPT/TIG domain-containing protein [Candidatus Nanopelagicales bacterium]
MHRRVFYGGGLGVALLGACIATSPEGIRRQTEQDQDGGITPGATPPDPPPVYPGSDPHAVLGANPSHGPFTGGQRVLIQGRGFSSAVRVWFGDTEVGPESLLPVDPGRVQVVAPPGIAGPVELRTQNGDDASTRRTLPGGYTYDALYAVPGSGPVSGGNIVEIHGQETGWGASTVVRIDQKPCAALSVESPTKLLCTVPKGTPGSKTVAVTTGDESLLVLDGYAYEDSENGFKGGLSGEPIGGRLKVLVYNNFTGDPIPAAQVIVGEALASALVGETDGSGVKLFEDAALTGPRTVTIAARCHSPISFVAVPVDTVTVYLDPVLTPACADGEGDPPPVGGKGGSAGAIQGELVWESVDEFGSGDWDNVPQPIGPTERQAAYVFLVGGDTGGSFQLPPGANAILPTTPGDFGNRFTIYASPGNRAMYALAGVEDRSVNPPRFTAYVMGAVRGVPVLPSSTTQDVFINMVKTLDQALTMDVSAPVPGPKGPDRLRASVSIMYGNEGFLNLPMGVQTPFIPFDGQLVFVGVPSLTGDLAGSSYVSTARAVTGPGNLAPMSVVGRVLTNTTSQVVPIGEFVGVPVLGSPASNGPWDGSHLETTFTGGAPVDLSVYDMVSGNGLIRWTVAVPMGSHAIELPDLRQLGLEHGSLPDGPVTIGVTGARIDGFDYANLRYRDMRPQGMTAYAIDTFNAFL